MNRRCTRFENRLPNDAKVDQQQLFCDLQSNLRSPALVCNFEQNYASAYRMYGSYLTGIITCHALRVTPLFHF